MQLTMVDQGGCILLVVQMSWSPYSQKLFDNGEESTMHCSKMPGLWSQVWVEQFVCRDCVIAFCLKELFCYIIEEWVENSNFHPTCESRQSTANTARTPS